MKEKNNISNEWNISWENDVEIIYRSYREVRQSKNKYDRVIELAFCMQNL